MCEFTNKKYNETHRIPAFPVDTGTFDQDWKRGLQENHIWWEATALETGSSLSDFIAGEKLPHKNAVEYEKFQKLHATLLACGGNETCFPLLEEDMDKILSRGYFRNGTSKMMRGRPSHCHSNVSELWERNHKDHDVTICTGYALSEDGMWRQHSWLLHRYKTATQTRERVVETTAKRLAYYGFEMTQAEAEEFVDNNF